MQNCITSEGDTNRFCKCVKLLIDSKLERFFSKPNRTLDAIIYSHYSPPPTLLSRIPRISAAKHFTGRPIKKSKFDLKWASINF